jgi:tetratricopeptide (TPR) repeat protein
MNKEKYDQSLALGHKGHHFVEAGFFSSAKEFFRRSLGLSREIGDRAGEARTLNNIGTVHGAVGDYSNALTYFEQSLGINRELGNKEGELLTCYNIGINYLEQADPAKALPHLRCAVELAEEIGHGNLDEYRKKLAEVMEWQAAPSWEAKK